MEKGVAAGKILLESLRSEEKKTAQTEFAIIKGKMLI